MEDGGEVGGSKGGVEGSQVEDGGGVGVEKTAKRFGGVREFEGWSGGDSGRRR